MSIRSRFTRGDIDLAVLHPENQVRTHVTPAIAALAQGWFSESLVVVGPPPSKPSLDKQQEQLRQERLSHRLHRLALIFHDGSIRATFNKNDQLGQGNLAGYSKAVSIGRKGQKQVSCKVCI